MIFKLFQLHKSSLISFHCYSIYQASSFKGMRAGLANKQYHYLWLKYRTKKKTPENIIFFIQEDWKKITTETSGSQLWQWRKTLFIIPDGAFMLSMQKIATLPYLSNTECMNVKGWFEIIAFSVDSSCCIITPISFWIYKNAYFFTKIFSPFVILSVMYFSIT